MDDIEIFTIVSDDGSEHLFMYVDEVVIDGNTYWLCEEVEQDPETKELIVGSEDGGLIAFKASKNGEEVFLDSIEDDAEFEKVSKYIENMEIPDVEFEDEDYDVVDEDLNDAEGD